MITEKEKVEFLAFLAKCKARRVKICLQKELPEFLGVSLSSIKSFEKGLIFDFYFLKRYAEFCGYTIYTDLIEKPIR
jgi:hypothetical protein